MQAVGGSTGELFYKTQKQYLNYVIILAALKLI
jgi:hypothetical protein